jgi:hypothetical protein|tara:strand:- start:58 stop:384 length:327 start_codon:yes stop_codon:yes gene_type:complete
MSSTNENSQDTSNEGYKLPSAQCLQNAARLSVVEDKPIMLDYWLDSLKTENSVLIGVKSDDEKLLVKSAEEYTSPISKIFKVSEEYIIISENSIYIVSKNIPTRRISS